jgi:putative membrane protein
MKDFFYRIFCGFFLGLSVVAPGISGSVMAVMMGIYRKLLAIATNPFKDFKKNFFYLFPMGIGAALSFAMFILSFSYLFETYEKATYLLFMGLIAGNLPVVLRNACQGGFKARYIIGALVSFALAIGIGVLRSGMSDVLAGSVSDPTLLYLSICGLASGITSMIPGMSVSMILILLGVYNFLMRSVKNIDIPVILVFGGCLVIGMLAFSRVTKFTFDRFHGFAYMVVFGFMSGSLIDIYIGLPAGDENFSWFIGLLMLAVGLGISLLFILLGRRFNADGSDAPPEAAGETS